MKPATARRIHRIHRWAGLIVAANLVLFCLTGLVLVFHEEIDDALGVIPPAPASAGRPELPLGQLVAAAGRARPGQKVLVAARLDDHPGYLFFSVAPPGTVKLEEGKPLLLDTRTGLPATTGDLEGGFTNVIFRLHAQLLLGPAGQLLVAALGLVLLTSLVTGFIVYGPFMRRFAFGLIRRGEARSIALGDLHKLVGGATWAWNLVVAGTGVFLAIGSQLIQLYAMTELRQATAAYTDRPPPGALADASRALETAARALPDEQFLFAIFPGAEIAGPHHYAFFMNGTGAFTKKLFKVALVDAGTAQLTLAQELPIYLKALLVSEPLHFGDYGGLPLKILWALFTVGTMTLAVTGVWVTFARRLRRRAGQPASDLEAEPERVGEREGPGAPSGEGGRTPLTAGGRP